MLRIIIFVLLALVQISLLAVYLITGELSSILLITDTISIIIFIIVTTVIKK